MNLNNEEYSEADRLSYTTVIILSHLQLNTLHKKQSKEYDQILTDERQCTGAHTDTLID